MSRRNRNGKAAAADTKVAKNLYLTAQTLAQGQQLKKAEKRGSFGNVVEWLISQEWERRFGKPQEKKEVAA